MSLTSYRAAPPRVRVPRADLRSGVCCHRIERLSLVRFGGDLLSHVLRRSTIGVTALNGRVRDGIGCLAVAMTTKPKQRQGVLRPKHQHSELLWSSIMFQVQAATCLQQCLLLTVPLWFSKRLSRQVELYRPCCYWIKSSLSSN